MNHIRYTLVTDGSFDQALLPLLTWLLQQHLRPSDVIPSWPDPRRLRPSPRGLAERIRAGLESGPCDLLFVHRDAEGQSRSARVTEIRDALQSLSSYLTIPPTVCVVPVRMTEAWLLCDPEALRLAANNPRGRQSLHLPPLSRAEHQVDPKATLHSALRAASGKRGQDLAAFSAIRAARAVSDLITDFSPLRTLPAFAELEAELVQVARENGWTKETTIVQ